MSMPALRPLCRSCLHQARSLQQRSQQRLAGTSQPPKPSLLQHQTQQQRQRSYIPAPAANSGPLLSRRSDRELPALNTINNTWRIWRGLPVLFVVIGAAAAGIFNYQKLNHSVVNASLYALRMDPLARELLGDEIYFRDRIPWIGGTIDSLHGHVDVKFGVKGKAGKGVMQFRCIRSPGDEFFHTDVWTLDMEDGRHFNLLETAAGDPMAGTSSIV